MPARWRICALMPGFVRLFDNMTNSDSAPNIGSVGRGPARGKVVAEWHIGVDVRSFGHSPDAQRPALGDAAVVKVYMTGLTLRAESPFLAKPREHTDLAQLHALVQDEVRRHLALHTGLDWQRYLRVEVRESSKSYRDGSTRGTEIGSKLIWFALGSDGKQYTVHDTNNVVVELAPELAPGDGPERAAQETTWETVGKNLGDDVRVVSRFYVPATEQNLAAVKRIQDRFDELSHALGEVLRPSQAASVLASIPAQSDAPLRLLGLFPSSTA